MASFKFVTNSVTGSTIMDNYLTKTGATDDPQILKNKTITDDTNDVSANKLKTLSNGDISINTSNAGNNGELLLYNSAVPSMEYFEPRFFTASFGGQINNQLEFLSVNGTAMTAGTTDPSSRIYTCPYDCYIWFVAGRCDALTLSVFDVLIDGVVAYTVSIGVGVPFFNAVTARGLVTQRQTIEVQNITSTAPVKINLQVYFKAF